MQIALAHSIAGVISACIRYGRGAEICGYLMADDSGREEFFALENRLASCDGCFIAAGDLRRAHKYARLHGLRIHAFVHSHATDTDLSNVDQIGLAQSDVPWIVVHLSEAGLLCECYAVPGR